MHPFLTFPLKTCQLPLKYGRCHLAAFSGMPSAQHNLHGKTGR